MISVRFIESKASPINGIGYRIVLGGATGIRPDIAVINVEQRPKKKQAAMSNAQCKAQSLSQPELSSTAKRYGKISARDTSNP